MKSKSRVFSLALCLLLTLAMCLCVFFAACSTSSDDNGNGTNPSGQEGTNPGEDGSGTDGGNGEDDYVNPGDSLGGAQEYTGNASLTETNLAETALAAVGTVSDTVHTTADEVKADSSVTELSGKTIKKAGAYYIEGSTFSDGSSVSGSKIDVTADGVTLYLINAELSNNKNIIGSDNYGLTLVLIGESTATETADDKTAIDIAGDLTILGSGSLAIAASDSSASIKNGIKANSISVIDATLSIDAGKDALHAEITSYDDRTEAPAFSYSDGGFVYTKNATLTLTAEDDGIQADTFVYVDEGSNVNVTAASKGVKAGLIDWGSDSTEIEDGDYLVYINGDVTVDSTDDAIHSNSTIIIEGGDIYIKAGDDAVHADDLLQVYGGYIEITECYEGLEAAKVEVTGGYVNVTSSDDGINGADGTTAVMGQANSNCHIILNGGIIYVDASGDGVDSNGDILISGGILFVSGSTGSNDAALDSESGIKITGGYVFACGALGMVETPSTSSTQYVISYAQQSTISAGTTLYLKDASGNTLLYYTVPKACQSVILSSPDLAKGSTYYIYGESTKLASCTISSIITSVGSSTSTMPGSSSNGSFGGNMGSGSGGSNGGFQGGFNSGFGSFGRH